MSLSDFLSPMLSLYVSCFFFFFNDPATTEIYTLSLHDALPIFGPRAHAARRPTISVLVQTIVRCPWHRAEDRKSTRLNSSHRCISYAVFCLKKKKKKTKKRHTIE